MKRDGMEKRERTHTQNHGRSTFSNNVQQRTSSMWMDIARTRSTWSGHLLALDDSHKMNDTPETTMNWIYEF